MAEPSELVQRYPFSGNKTFMVIASNIQIKIFNLLKSQAGEQSNIDLFKCHKTQWIRQIEKIF